LLAKRRISEMTIKKRSETTPRKSKIIAQGNIKITESALNWWLLDAQRQTWLRLSQMAIDLSSILAMSDE